MINILHTIDTTGPGGAETIFIELVKSLDKNRYKSLVVITGKGWVFDQLQNHGVEPIIVETKGSFDVRYLYRLIRIIKRYKPQIIHSHLLTSSVYCSLAGLIIRVPVVATFHGAVDISYDDRLLNTKFKIINLGAKKVIFVSDQLKNTFLSTTTLRPNNVKIIYNGIDTTRFAPRKDNSLRNELGLQANDIIVGSIGNIRQPKAYDVLLEAAAILVRESRRFKFVIVGQGSGTLYDGLITKRNQLHLQAYVSFLGFRDNISSLLNTFDVFLLTSRSEGFSLSTIEAMACGVPVIATKSGGPEEIIAHKVNGILVDINAPTQIVQAVKLVIEDDSLARQLVRKARQDVIAKFAIQSMVRKYEQLYDSI